MEWKRKKRNTSQISVCWCKLGLQLQGESSSHRSPSLNNESTCDWLPPLHFTLSLFRPSSASIHSLFLAISFDQSSFYAQWLSNFRAFYSLTFIYITISQRLLYMDQMSYSELFNDAEKWGRTKLLLTHFIEQWKCYLEKSFILYGWKSGLDAGPFDEGENDAKVVGLDEDDGSRGEGGHPWYNVSGSQQPLALLVLGAVLSEPGPRMRPGVSGNAPTPGVTGCLTR